MPRSLVQRWSVEHFDTVVPTVFEYVTELAIVAEFVEPETLFADDVRDAAGDRCDARGFTSWCGAQLVGWLVGWLVAAGVTSGSVAERVGVRVAELRSTDRLTSALSASRSIKGFGQCPSIWLPTVRVAADNTQHEPSVRPARDLALVTARALAWRRHSD